MNRLVLERFLKSDHGTFGTLDLNGYTFFTLEDEWLDNKPNVSAIPEGVYPVHPTVWHKQGLPTYEVADVPGRSRILFHPGNTEEDTQGCILLGMNLGVVKVKRDEELGVRNKKLAVIKSRAAHQRFMERMNGPAMLEVQWYV